MLWVFLIAGLIGVLCGSLYRAPALILLSFTSLIWVSILLLVSGSPLGESLITAFLVTAALQMGYLLGVGCGNLWHHLWSRASLYWPVFSIAAISQRARRRPILNG